MMTNAPIDQDLGVSGQLELKPMQVVDKASCDIDMASWTHETISEVLDVSLEVK